MRSQYFPFSPFGFLPDVPNPEPDLINVVINPPAFRRFRQAAARFCAFGCRSCLLGDAIGWSPRRQAFTSNRGTFSVTKRTCLGVAMQDGLLLVRLADAISE